MKTDKNYLYIFYLHIFTFIFHKVFSFICTLEIDEYYEMLKSLF